MYSSVKVVFPVQVPSLFMTKVKVLLFRAYPEGAKVSLKVYLPGVKEKAGVCPLLSVTA